jgi:selenide, water dikinase
MLELNRHVCDAMLEDRVHGCTDVTGFGLLGHAREMALGSGATLEIAAATVRFLPGALEYARQGAIPGGLKNNRAFVSPDVEIAGTFPDEVETLLYDPQTSGGLLISLPPDAADRLEQRLPGQAYRIGSVQPKQQKPIRLV